MAGKVHQQDRITNDNAGERDEADHRGGGKLGTEQPVARDDADQGQRDRSHDDGRQAEVAEFHHHQHVDQDDRGSEGHAHVAEGLVGDRPFTGPLEGGLIVCFRRTGPGRLQLDAIRSRVVLEVVLDIHHAVDGRAEATGSLASDIFNGTQILVIDHRLLHASIEIAKLAQRNGIAILAGDGDFLQPWQIRPGFVGHLDDNEGRLELVAALHIAEYEIAEGHAQGAVDGIHRYAPAHGLLAVHFEAPDLVGLGHQRIDIGDVGRAHEHLLEIACHLATDIVVGAIHLGNDGLQHRRSGRHLDYLDTDIVSSFEHLQQLAPHILGDLVTAALALALVHQLHLDVGFPGLLPQVVMPYKTVEIERRSGADIGLQGGDFGHL